MNYLSNASDSIIKVARSHMLIVERDSQSSSSISDAAIDLQIKNMKGLYIFNYRYYSLQA